jgi:hypothetical protein
VVEIAERLGRFAGAVLNSDEARTALAAGTRGGLRGGTVWSTKRSACTISRGRTVTRTNRSRHGFTIGNGRYGSF